MRREPEENSRFNLVVSYVGIFMAVLYILLGTAIFFKASEFFGINFKYAPLAGIMLVLYGCYRGFRAYQKIFGK